ncbi:MAG: hypothetical protein ACE5ID_12645, partial [Acidobacteriota bacterium]
MQDIDQLFDRLNSPDGGTAEAALARLTVLGARMVEPLLARYPAAPEAMRPRLLLLLERCPDFRAVPLLRMEILSPSLAIRRQAVRALGRMDRASTARLLLDTLKREHS